MPDPEGLSNETFTRHVHKATARVTSTYLLLSNFPRLDMLATTVLEDVSLLQLPQLSLVTMAPPTLAIRATMIPKRHTTASDRLHLNLLTLRRDIQNLVHKTSKQEVELRAIDNIESRRQSWYSTPLYVRTSYSLTRGCTTSAKSQADSSFPPPSSTGLLQRRSAMKTGSQKQLRYSTTMGLILC